MFLKIGKLLTKHREKYWKNIFELMVFFNVKEKIHKKNVRIFEIIIANYGINPDEIAIKKLKYNILYGLKSDRIKVYFILSKRRIIPLWSCSLTPKPDFLKY